MTVRAYAIKQGGEINVRSVSPTDIAAKVNWLCTDCFLPLRDDLDDATVDRVFKKFADEVGATCVIVDINETKSQPEQSK